MATKNGDPEKEEPIVTKEGAKKPYEDPNDPIKQSKKQVDKLGKYLEEGFEFREYNPEVDENYSIEIELAREEGNQEELERLENERRQYKREAGLQKYNKRVDEYNEYDAVIDSEIRKATTQKEINRLKKIKLANLQSKKDYQAEVGRLYKPKTERVAVGTRPGGYSPTYSMGAGGSGEETVYEDRETGELEYDDEGISNFLIASTPPSQLPQKDYPQYYEDDGSGGYKKRDYGFKRGNYLSTMKPPQAENPFNIQAKTRESTIVDAPEEAEDRKRRTDIEYDEFEYQDTTTDGIGLIDYLQPATQLLTGLVGASEPLPDPTMSPEMRTIIDEDMARRNQGLSPDEIDYRNRQAERGYAYDVKNIANMSGGSAGMALANLGRAAGTLQGQYSRTAAEDEAMRRQNRAYARQAAGLAEDFERYDFGIQYDEAMMDAQAAGMLAQTGMQEFTDLRQYQRNYGEGSPYLEYMRLLNKEKALANFESEQLSKNIPALLEYRANQGIIKQEESQSNNSSADDK